MMALCVAESKCTMVLESTYFKLREILHNFKLAMHEESVHS